MYLVVEWTAANLTATKVRAVFKMHTERSLAQRADTTGREHFAVVIHALYPAVRNESCGQDLNLLWDFGGVRSPTVQTVLSLYSLYHATAPARTVSNPIHFGFR